MKFRNQIYVFSHHVNTDEIIPARYLNTSDPAVLAQYCMEDLRPNFAKQENLVGKIFVAGDNFGCGSSREHAPISIKGAGIACVIAQSFARIFFRNCINIGLPIVELPDTSLFREGDELEIDLQQGAVTNHSQQRKYSFSPYPDFLEQIINVGGWLPFAVKNQTNSIEL
jgi:3-isopropylmalate/(R)-2-methylmalate dehydratase small subunit